MTFFAANVVTMRRILEQAWRSMAEQAAEHGLLGVDEVGLEFTIRLKMPKGRQPRQISSRTVAVLNVKGQPRIRQKAGDTAWKRLMKTEE